jgi:hypothetical protein
VSHVIFYFDDEDARLEVFRMTFGDRYEVLTATTRRVPGV